MTEEVYSDLMGKLINTFNQVYETDPSDENAKAINFKANTLVNITKVCIQTEIVRRSNEKIRATIAQNVSRIANDSSN